MNDRTGQDIITPTVKCETGREGRNRKQKRSAVLEAKQKAHSERGSKIGSHQHPSYRQCGLIRPRIAWNSTVSGQCRRYPPEFVFMAHLPLSLKSQPRTANQSCRHLPLESEPLRGQVKNSASSAAQHTT